MEWIDIPAHRVLVINHEEYDREFTPLNEQGFATSAGECPYRIVRNRDQKMFRIADFLPFGSAACCQVTLREI